MFEALKAKLGAKDTTVSLESNEQLAALTTQLTELTELVGSLNAALEEKENALLAAQSKLTELVELAQEAEAQAELAKAKAAETVLEAKRTKLASVMGKDNPSLTTTFDAVSSLGDEAFNVVVEGFRTAQAAEAKSILFSEVGVSGETIEDKTSEVNATMRILTEKFQSK